MTRVLVVDDSRLMRSVIQKTLVEQGYEVTVACDGREAVNKVHEFEPDVITMDVHMPEMNGIEAVKEIMDERPTPILMVSAHTERGAEYTLDAMEHGAVDFLTKPDGEVSMRFDEMADELVESVEALSTVDPESLSTGSSDVDYRGWYNTAPKPEDTTNLDRRKSDTATIVIGASTGGPQLVEEVMRDLPIELNARVIIVQHMPAHFTSRFADRLDRCSAYDVSEAENDDAIGPREAVVAPGDKDIRVTGDVHNNLLIQLRDGARISPSIDTAMVSAVSYSVGPCIGVALTGMGDDGAKGVKAISDGGGYTIAQNKETSPVFGIPKRAIQTGAVDKIVPDTEIVDAIVDSLKQHANTADNNNSPQQDSGDY